MLEIELTSKMKRDVKRMQKRGKDMLKLREVLKLLVSHQVLPLQFKDHQLRGEMREYRECHIEPDWLLIYQIFEDRLTLLASGTGSHSDLFDQ